MATQINKFDKKIVELTERIGFKIALFSVAATTILGNAVIAPALPQMSAYFKACLGPGFTFNNLDILVRLVLTIPALFVLLLSPFAGYLMDRFGKLRFVFPALILWAVAGVSGYFLDNIYLLIISRALLGVSMAFLMIGASALLADYYSCGVSNRRENALSWQGFFCACGGSLFIYGGGMLSMISWRAPFLIYSCGLLILLICIIYLFEPRHKKKLYKKLPPISYKPYFQVYFAGFFSMLIFYIVPTQLPYFLENKLSFSPNMVGIAIGSMAFLEGIFSLTYKRLSKLIAIKGIYIFSFFLMGLGFLGLHFFSSFYPLAFCLILIGIALAYMLINNSEYLFKIAPSFGRARAFGLLACCLFASQFISPLLTQPVVLFMGYRGLFLLCAFLLFVCSFIYLFLFKERSVLA